MAYGLLGLGAILVASKCWVGWLGYLAGDLLWLYIGWRMRMSSIWLWQIPFIGVVLYGLWNWTT